MALPTTSLLLSLPISTPSPPIPTHPSQSLEDLFLALESVVGYYRGVPSSFEDLKTKVEAVAHKAFLQKHLLQIATVSPSFYRLSYERGSDQQLALYVAADGLLPCVSIDPESNLDDLM